MKFLENLYIKVFVNIIVGKEATSIYIENYVKGSVKDVFEDSFETLHFNDKMLQFINLYIRETPFFYISILDMSSSQGAIPSCLKNRIAYYCDTYDLEYKCQDSKWMNYTAKADLYEIEKKYSQIGIDFVFSSFSLISHFFKDKIDGNIALFILMQEEFISVSVFHNAELLYAQHIVVTVNTQSDGLISVDESEEELVQEDELDDGIDLDDIDALDDIESLDDFGDIEDLDSLDEIDEFADTRDIEEELTEEAEDEGSPISDSDGFTEDYHRFSMIQSAVNNFYKDPIYSSQFIETVYIADGVGVSGDLKTYLEEEMFLSVYIRRVELTAEVCELAKMELK